MPEAQPSKFNIELAIVIPVRNQLVYTQQCLKSLRKHTKDARYAIVLVDNGCVDGTVEWVQQYCTKNGIKLSVVDAKDIRVNLSAVWNRGVKRAISLSPKYIAVINNDVVVYRKWWDKFRDMFEVADKDTNIWMAVPRSTRLDKPIDWEAQAEVALKDNRGANAPLTGWFMVFRANVFDPQVVGLFDERFRLWFGDNDMYLRLAESGHAPVQLYSVLIHHYESRTLNDTSPKTPLPDKEGVIREDQDLFEEKWPQGKRRDATGVDERPGVTLAVPNMGEIRTELVSRMLQLQNKDQKYAFSYFLASGMAFHDYARNMIVEDFLKRGDEWLIMVDADIIPPPNFLKLIEHGGDKKIIGAVCHVWTNGQLQATIYDKDEASGLYETRPSAQAFVGLIETPVTGTGCIAIHRDVFKAMKKPYFQFEYDPETRSRVRGEDIYFCEQAAKAGFKTYVDTDVVTNHVKSIGMYGIFKMTNEFTKQVIRKYDQRVKAEASAAKPARQYHIAEGQPPSELAPPQPAPANTPPVKATKYEPKKGK